MNNRSVLPTVAEAGKPRSASKHDLVLMRALFQVAHSCLLRKENETTLWVPFNKGSNPNHDSSRFTTQLLPKGPTA
jgi:hypothetical protein